MKSLKKIGLLSLLCIPMLVGCNSPKDYKVGLGHSVSVQKTNGVITQINLSFASVVFDGEKIVSAYIDELQLPFTYDATAGLSYTAGRNQTSQAGTKLVETKKELGDRYGMSDAPKGDWYVQAAKIEDWAKGKKAADLTYGSDNKPTGDLASDVTITVDGNIEAIKMAYTNANSFKASKAPSAGMGVIVGEIEAKTNYYQIDINFASVASVGDKVGGSVIDVYQLPIALDATDFAAGTNQTSQAGTKLVESKRQLGDRYGMSSAPKGDWYVQAAKIEEWSKGKKSEDLTYGSDKKPTGDLASDVTITIDTLVEAIKEGLVNKKA